MIEFSSRTWSQCSILNWFHWFIFKMWYVQPLHSHIRLIRVSFQSKKCVKHSMIQALNWMRNSQEIIYILRTYLDEFWRQQNTDPGFVRKYLGIFLFLIQLQMQILWKATVLKYLWHRSQKRQNNERRKSSRLDEIAERPKIHGKEESIVKCMLCI